MHIGPTALYDLTVFSAPDHKWEAPLEIKPELTLTCIH